MSGASSQEKTEEATPHKLQKAREKGEVAKSQDMASAMLLLAAFGLLTFQAGAMGEAFQRVLTTCFQRAQRDPITPKVMLETLGEVSTDAMAAIIPLMIVLALMGLAVMFVQVGALLAFETLKPKLEKLNPISGLKRLFFSLPTYVELIKSIVKLLVIGAISWIVIQTELEVILQLGKAPPVIILAQTVRIISRCVFYMILFFIGMSVLDLFYQQWQYKKNQRMTKEEVKKEHKQMEGDPEHKQKRKELHEEINQGMMLSDAREADVMVTNPDHIACALRYDPDKDGAPRLLAKGTGHLAEKLKQIAKEEGIPILRDPSVARALHELEINTEVPKELYDAMVGVLKWVEMTAAQRGALPRWRQTKEHEGG